MSASISEKAAVQAPIARPSETIAATETTASLRSSRRPRRKSRSERFEPRQELHVAARLANCRRWPNRRVASSIAASRERPRAIEIGRARVDVKPLLVLEIVVQAIGSQQVGDT